MIDLKYFHDTIGLRSCCISNEKIVDNFLLSDEELKDIQNLTPLLGLLPQDFMVGVVEIESCKKYCVFKVEDNFVIAPVSTDNIGDLCKKIIDCVGGHKNGS